MKTNSIYILSVFSLLLSCYKEEPVSKESIIIGFTAPESVPADGKSAAAIEVKIPPKSAADRRTVTFKTTRGIFEQIDKNETTVKAEFNEAGELVAKTSLRSTVSVENALVTAAIGGITDSTTIRFAAAAPDDILLHTDKQAIYPGYESEATVSIILIRNIGKVSEKAPVTFTVADEKGTILSHENKIYIRNSNLLTDENGKCSFTLSVGNSAYLGKLRIVAKAGSITSKELFIYSIPKPK
ncbi:hypothetical protein [Dyadobacter bucti]|uniref:hypothetical protein n=1 Tax=Dyadobacter bucti TaxID=2572203 RepID=UPI001107CD27|nr:hypothetical protein [Dyadobacter bucti]